MPLFYICFAWLAGTVLGSQLLVPLWLPAVPLIFLLPALLIPNHRRLLIVICLCLIAFAGGALRYQSTIQPADDKQLQFYNGTGEVKIEGTVSGPPDIQNTSTVFKFSTHKLIGKNDVSTIRGDALVRLPFYRDLRYGDDLIITGKPETPSQFDDFDYKNYLAYQGIYSVVNYPSVRVVSSAGGFQLLSWIYTLRDHLAQSLSLSLPEPQCSLAQAILLGLRGNLPQSLTQSFYVTGTTHLIAISGQNLTIVLGMILSVSVWLFGRKNRIYIWISLAFLWFYTILTGMPASMIRAAVMGSVFLLAELLGMQRNGLAALCLAAALMTAIEPPVLWDPGFQLSFLSMLGLVLIAPYLIQFISPPEETGHNKFAESLKKIAVIGFGTTMAAIIATWPITAMDFHSFSLVGAPATFFLMPSFPGIMVVSIFTSLAGLVWQPLGTLIGWIDWIFLSYFILVVHIFSSIPVAYIQNFKLDGWQVLSYYVMLVALLLSVKYRQRVTGILKSFYSQFVNALANIGKINLKPYLYWILSFLLLANTLVWTAFSMLPDGKLHVFVLDVGQGESILIRTAEGQNILVDSGPDPLSACTQLGNNLPFWDRHIQLLLQTQLQSDHCTGTIELLNRYYINRLAITAYNNNSALSRELMGAAAQKSIEPCILHGGQKLKLGEDAWLDVLNPPQTLYSGTSDDANNNSMVLRLTYNHVSFLLTSDIGMEAERYLMENRADLHCDVLKVAHHGSRGSTSYEFLSIVHPSAAAISAGIDNRFGHPSEEVVKKLSAEVGSDRIFITAKQGNIEFITDGNKLWYKTEK
ncbi:MAG: ComEC/Rec2 family competence protein [Dehalococcoidia bacterium]|jgi:competence protein ComEC